MKKGKILILAVIMSFSFVGCNKYPDGPAVSLRTKTERVANSWKVAQALENGNDVTSDYNQFDLDLSKKGEAKLSANFTVFGADYQYTTSGSWSFVNTKESISFDFENDDADGVYTILKLKEDEMWLKRNGDNVELHFVSR